MKKKIIIILIIICTLSMIYSVYKIVMWKIDNDNTKEIISNIKNDINYYDDVDTDPDSGFKLIDFEELKKKNSDTVAWISVNGTNVNYPVVQSKDNSYYLTKSFDKKYSAAGWIFLDYRNDINNLSNNTIIYGHNRLDESMFGSLKNALNKNWFNNLENQFIELNTETYDSLWQIFSVYHIKTESYYITTKFENNNDYATFINTLLKRSAYDFNVKISTNDKILTLSTCYKSTQKMVIHAILIKKEDK